MSSQPVVSARGVSKRFRGVVALRDVDLDVYPGSVTAFTGPNGAGKTTLLRVFATLVRPDSGLATVCGHDVSSDAALVRGCIGVSLVNERSVYWRLSGLGNLQFFGRTSGLSKREAKSKAEELVVELALADVAGRSVASWSAGQRQRLLLARAAMTNPAVLIVDEPMRGLDEAGVAAVRRLLVSSAAGGAAVVVAAPLIADFEDVCDEVVALEAGAVADRTILRVATGVAPA